MGQDGRDHGEDQDCNNGASRFHDPLSPQKYHPAAQPEERQIADAGERETLVIVVSAVKNFSTGSKHLVLCGGTPAIQVWSDGCHDARQGRMLRLITVDMLVQPLDAAREVGWLVRGVVEDR